MPRISVTTANICGTPLRPKWAVRKRMRRALTQSGAVFGQEVAGSARWADSDTYSAMWHRVAARMGKVTYGGPHEVPISVPKDWQVTSSQVLHATPGKKNISPDRFITVVTALVGNKKIALVNCHPVSKPRLAVPFGAWRIAMWTAYHDLLVQVVTGLVTSGHSVVFGGDMNKNFVPVVHPGQRALVDAGLDHLWIVTAAGVSVSSVTNARVGVTALMDHPILTTSFTY